MRTLKDKLSHLSFAQACRLLGPQGKELIMAGGRFEIDLYAQVRFNQRRFALDLGAAKVALRLDPRKPERLLSDCSVCRGACVHQGAALALILEEKLALGLSAPPKERVPMEHLSEKALIEQALTERRQRARDEKMRLKTPPPGFYGRITW